MDTKSLKIFQHLASNLHFAKTAEAFHVSASTLSRIVQRIEAEVGSDLFLRDNRTVLLTPAGKQFLAFAEQQLEQWHLLKLSLEQEQAQLSGVLHIYCSVTAAYSHLPPLLERFRQQHPLVEIMLTTGDAADAVDQVQQQSVDLAIAARPESLSRQFYFHPIAEIPMTMIAPTMACAVQQQLKQADVPWQDIPIILPEHGPARKRFEHWFRRKNVGKPNIYATVSGHEAIVSMVALGCGVGVSPQVVVDNSPVQDRVISLTSADEIAPFELGICCLNQQKSAPIVTAFFEAIS